MRRPSGAWPIRARTISWVGKRVMSRPSNRMRPSRALGEPQIVWLQAGHYSSLTFFPLMQKTVIEFLRDGKRPETAAANAGQ